MVALIAAATAAQSVQASPPAKQAEPDPAEIAAARDYATAAGLQSRKLHAQAADRWRKFLADHGKDTRIDKAHQHLGTCLLQDGKPAEAAAVFKTLVEKFPKFAALDATHLNWGLALQQVATASKKPEDFRAAAAVFAAIPAKFKDSRHAPAGLWYQAECLFSAGDVDAAIAGHRRLLADHAGHELAPSAMVALGTALQEQGKDAEAEPVLAALIRLHPKDPAADECRLRLGLALAAQKKHAEAETVLGQAAAVKDFAYADFALLRQAQAAWEQGRFDPAGDLYAALPVRFPKSAHVGAALLAAGKCRFRAGKFAESLKLLSDLAAKAGPESVEATLWQVRSLAATGRHAEAATIAEKALPAAGNGPYGRAMLLARNDALAELPDRRAEAVKLYAEFAARRPADELTPRALYLAGVTALRAGDAIAARTHADAFLADAVLARHELVPEVVFVAAEARVLATGSAADAAGALTLYRRLVAEHAAHAHAPVARLRIGWCLHTMGRHDEAVAQLRPLTTELKDPAALAEAWLLTGLSESAAGRPAGAVTALLSAQKAKPDWDRADEVLLATAVAQRADKKDADAAATLAALLQRFPKGRLADHALYQAGEVSAAAGKHDEAERRFAAVVADHAKSDLVPAALYGIAGCRLARNEPDKAAETLTTLLAAHGASPVAGKARLLRGLALQRAGKHAASEADLLATLSAKPSVTEAADARYALVLALAAQKKFEPAAAALAALMKEHPAHPLADRAHYEVAFALAEADRGKEAAAVFDTLARIRPDSPLAGEALFRAGSHHESAKEWDAAATAYTAGLKHAKSADLREKLGYKLGWVRHSAGKFAEAAAALQDVLKEHPKGSLAVDVAFLAAESLFRAGRFADALPLFAPAIAAKSPAHHARALYRSGAAALETRQWDAAGGHYEALLAAFPKFELAQDALYGLGWSLQNRGKLTEAVARYEACIKLGGTETAAKARFMVGECAFREGRHAKAVEHFLEVAVGFPYPHWQALGHFEAARCLIELKEPAKAAAELETMLKKFPEHPSAKDATRLLASLRK